MFIESPPSVYRALFPGVVWRIVDSETPTVYLTFDDGPIPEVTPRILDILDSFGVKASFFMVGENARRNPELPERIRRDGHTVGSHTMRHLKGLYTPVDEYLNDARRCADLLGTRLFRPPHGVMRPSQLRLLRSHYNIIMYDVVTRDYAPELSADDVLSNVMKYVRDGSIIVFHDSLKALPRVIDALPRTIEWLISQGYELRALPHG